MGEITLRQGIEEYTDIFLPARNLAERTREEYLNDLDDLVRFLEKKGKSRVDEIDLIHLEQYLAELERKGYAGSSRKRKAIVIRSFLSFLYSGSFITNNVARQLIPPFVDNNNPRFLNRDEQERLLRACSNHPRDKAIIGLLLQTGIALGELTRLRVYDIEIPKELEGYQNRMGVMCVSGGRGRKSRNLPLDLNLCQAIEEYIRIRPDVETDVLFINKFGFPLGKRGIQKLVKKYLDKAGIRYASVSSLRHTYGVHLASVGVSLKTIQEIMGLKDIRTASTYNSLSKKRSGDIEHSYL